MKICLPTVIILEGDFIILEDDLPRRWTLKERTRMPTYPKRERESLECYISQAQCSLVFIANSRLVPH